MVKFIRKLAGDGKEREFVFYFSLSILLSLPFLLMPLENPDIGWHLATAKWMISNLKFCHYDIFSWSKDGFKWINSEWLSQIIFYFFYKISGYPGLYLLRLLNILLISISISFLLRVLKVNSFNLIWFLPSFFISILNIMDLRPDNYTIFLFIVLFIFLHLNRDEQELKTSHKIFLFSLFIIWVNIHPGYIYGISLLLIYFSGSILNENLDYIYGKTRKISFSKSKKYIKLILISFTATLINPYGYKIYSVFFEHLSNLSIYQNYISEWQELNIEKLNVLFSFLYVSFSLIVYLYKFIKYRNVDFIKIFLIVFFIINSAFHIRLNVYGVIVASFILLESLSEKLGDLKYRAIFSFLLIFSGYYITSQTIFDNFLNLLNKRLYIPMGSYLSVEFIKKNVNYFKNLKIYNGWNIGGFLDFELYGTLKTFMDGRYIFTDMLEEHIKANSEPGKWEEFTDKYDIDAAILYLPSELRNIQYEAVINDKVHKFIRPYYVENIDFKKWALVYFDKKIFIIVRRNRVGIDFLERNEYRFLKPYDFDRLYIDAMMDRRYVKDIKKEILRYISLYNGNPESFYEVFVYIFYDMIDIEKGVFKFNERS